MTATTTPPAGAGPGGVDDQLSAHPRFGDSDKISARSRRRHAFGLEILAEQVKAVRTATLDLGGPEIDLLLRDPVVRIAVEDALRRLEAGGLADPDPLGEILLTARRRLEASPGALPTQAEERDRVGAGPGGRIWMMTNSGLPGPLRRRMLAAIRDQFLDYNQMAGEITRADPSVAQQVTKGIALLAELLPRTGAGVVRHVDCIVLMRAGGVQGRQLSAAGGDLVPGTVAMDPDIAASPWETAGTILHEGLHLKTFDITRLFALVAPDRGTVAIPWRNVRWDTRRVLFAFHVYAHLTVLEAAIAAAGDRLGAAYGPPPAGVGVSHGAAEEYAGARERARYLGDLLTGPLAVRLAPDGRLLVDWLREVTAPYIGWDRSARPAPGAGEPGEGARVPRCRRVPGLWLRQEPDLECLQVFNPKDRTLHSLNLAAWAVLELCDGRGDIGPAFAEMVGERMPAAETHRMLHLAVHRLLSAGLIVASEEGR